MTIARFAPLVIISIGLAACGGGGGGTPGSGSGTIPQSQYVTPKFVLSFPVSGATPGSAARKPKFIGQSSLGVTITLVSSSIANGPQNVSVTSALTTGNGGDCTISNNVKTCTVSGPPVPPGTDVFAATTYDTAPTGSPLTEPGGAHALATSTSTASPAQSNPSFMITAGTSNPGLAITLYGVPATFTFAGGVTGTANAAFNSPVADALTVLDFAGDTITGEFSQPVTVSDSDTTGSQGSGLAISPSTTGATSVTLNSATDASNLTVTYGGLAIVSPTFTASSSGATSQTDTFAVTLNPITSTATEVDLYNTSGTGSTGGFTLAEFGWSNAPYNKSFTTGTATCTGSSTAATVFGLTNIGDVYTDTTPSSGAAAGSCTVPFTDFTGGNSITETLTYTTGSIGINGARRR